MKLADYSIVSLSKLAESNRSLVQKIASKQLEWPIMFSTYCSETYVKNQKEYFQKHLKLGSKVPYSPAPRTEDDCLFFLARMIINYIKEAEILKNLEEEAKKVEKKLSQKWKLEDFDKTPFFGHELCSNRYARYCSHPFLFWWNIPAGIKDFRIEDLNWWQKPPTWEKFAPICEKLPPFTWENWKTWEKLINIFLKKELARRKDKTWPLIEFAKSYEGRLRCPGLEKWIKQKMNNEKKQRARTAWSKRIKDKIVQKCKHLPPDRPLSK